MAYVLAEVQAEIADIKAQLATQTKAGGAQAFGMGGTTLTRVQFNNLTARLNQLSVIESRMVAATAARSPDFPSKS